MANYIVTDTELTSIADAIRTKGGTSAALEFPSGFATAVSNIPTGGGGTVEPKDVNFIDYDGTLVASKTKAEINAMTSNSDLPANPTHEGLTAQGWNWTVTQLKAQLTAMPDQPVTVGQMYTTQSGKTEIDITLPEGRLSPRMSYAVNGEISVDWGDNSEVETFTGSSLTSRAAGALHEYSAAGNYTIKVSVVSGSWSFLGTTTYLLLYKGNTSNQSPVYSNCVKAIRIGNNTSIGEYSFYNCYSLQSITIPNTVTAIATYAFYNCYSLKSITIPSMVDNIGNSTFNTCYSLQSVTIPSTVTSIGNNAFYSCVSLQNITLPNGVTSIGTNTLNNCYSLQSITIPSTLTSIGGAAFYNCYSLNSVAILSAVTSLDANTFYKCSSLQNITIPNTVTSIGNNAFYGCNSLSNITIPSEVTSIGDTAFSACYGMSEYHVLPTAVPTAGTTILKSLPSDCVIYVPQGKLSDYQGASGWSTYASYMQEEPST